MTSYEGPFPSDRKDKKMFVIVHGDHGGRDHDRTKKVYFGDPNYEDYTQHKDPKRRIRYLARATKIKDKNGYYTFNNPFSPNYWSTRILWNLFPK